MNILNIFNNLITLNDPETPKTASGRGRSGFFRNGNRPEPTPESPRPFGTGQLRISDRCRPKNRRYGKFRRPHPEKYGIPALFRIVIGGIH